TPTIMEYIYDKALKDAGVPDDQVKTSEIKNLSVRLQMLTSGGIKAAVLPWTLHSLAVSQGATSLLGVEQASSYSSTVLAFRDAWLKGRPDTDAVMAALMTVWDAEVAKINAAPEKYRTLLAAQAKLPAPLDQTYTVRQYPTHAIPDQAQFEAVVTWMVSKGYIKSAIAYDDLVWSGAK
ncbi:MAG: ABC transporter substrate-binding protein, partial [Actinomycetia bacterium]|nr:ABC transporter substrate-binding protein [Actinomycetes bacterium]